MLELYSETGLENLPTKSGAETVPIWSETDGNGVFTLLNDYRQSELVDVLELYGSLAEVSIFQHPEWDQLVSINGDVLYFTYRKDDELQAFAAIRFPNDRFAEIEFGPVAISEEAGIIALRKILKAVRSSTSAWYLRVQMPGATLEDSGRLEARLSDDFDFKTFDDKRNWGTSFIDTNRSNDELQKEFSKNHRRSIKKAAKLGLTARVFESEEDLKAFNDIFVRMYEVRGESINPETNLKDYQKLNEFFRRTGNGFFFGVFQDEALIGGMIIIRQGDYGFYYHSASDPEHRKVPVLHSGVFSVLDELRARKIRFFDFGGYNHMVDESDQVYNINRFKDGFTKEYLYFPKLMYFEFAPNAVRMLEFSQSLKDKAKKVIGLVR